MRVVVLVDRIGKTQHARPHSPTHIYKKGIAILAPALTHRFGELVARLHDAEAEGDDLRLEEEGDHLRVIHLP